MRRRVGGRDDAQRFATPHDQSVQVINLTSLAARQILRGQCVLARHRLGNLWTATSTLPGIVTPPAFATATHSSTRSRMTTVMRSPFTSRPYGNSVIASGAWQHAAVEAVHRIITAIFISNSLLNELKHQDLAAKSRHSRSWAVSKVKRNSGLMNG